ncbi:MAG: helix-turn-helix domain-containing protein [Gammaproteobacteria bacterium]|nr:helix-turn-helix domain-containing protein [Gammaproteobacteria bacterium]
MQQVTQRNVQQHSRQDSQQDSQSQETFASRLARLIQEHDISHAEVGRIVGVSGQAVGKWAKGGNIEYENLQALSRHFGVNWIWLRYGDDAMVAFSERRTGSKARRAVIRDIVENEQRVRLALGIAEIGTWDLDIIGDQLVMSDVTRQLLGVPGDAPDAGKDGLLDCVSEAERAMVDEALIRVLENHQLSFDVTHGVNGRSVRVRQRGKVVTDDVGRPVRMMCVITAADNA